MGAVIPGGGGAGVEDIVNRRPLALFETDEQYIGYFTSAVEKTISTSITIPQQVRDIADYFGFQNTPNNYTGMAPWFVIPDSTENVEVYPEFNYSHCGQQNNPPFCMESRAWYTSQYSKTYRFYKDVTRFNVSCYYTGSGITWGDGNRRYVTASYLVGIDSARLEVDEVTQANISNYDSRQTFNPGFYAIVAGSESLQTFNHNIVDMKYYLTGYSSDAPIANCSYHKTKFLYILNTTEYKCTFPFNSQNQNPVFICKLKIADKQ